MNKNNDRKAAGIVLAGVHSWKKTELEQSCPRPLLPVAGQPLVWHLLDRFQANGILNATICANSDTEAFRQCVGDGGSLGMALTYYRDQMPRGPAGCVRDAALQTDADDFLVIDGTMVTEVNLEDLLWVHRRSGASITIAVVCSGSADTGDRGPMEPAGICVVSRRAVEHVGAKGYQDIKEVWIPRLYELKEPVVTHVVPSIASRRITGPLSYLEADARVVGLSMERCAADEEYRRIGEARVHRSSRVDPVACLAGQVLVGPGCVIERGGTVVGPATIGPDCRIEPNSFVSHSVMWQGSRVGTDAVVDHCILTSGSSVATGSIVRDTVQVAGQTRGREDLSQAGFYWSPPPFTSSPRGNGLHRRRNGDSDSSPASPPRQGCAHATRSVSVAKA